MQKQFHSEVTRGQRLPASHFSMAREISEEYKRLHSKDFTLKGRESEGMDLRDAFEMYVQSPAQRSQPFRR